MSANSKIPTESSLSVRQVCAIGYGYASPLNACRNLLDRQLEVFTSPEPTGYLSCTVMGLTDRAPLVIGGVEVGLIAVADLLP
jgi:hypothetical protein